MKRRIKEIGIFEFKHHRYEFSLFPNWPHEEDEEKFYFNVVNNNKKCCNCWRHLGVSANEGSHKTGFCKKKLSWNHRRKQKQK